MKVAAGTGSQNGFFKPETLQPQVPVPVIVANEKLRSWKGLRRCFTRKAGFLLIDAVESPGHLLLQCQRLAPCVLIAELAFVESLDPGDFAVFTDFGRATRVLVYGPVCDERTIQNLIRLGCAGAIGENESPALLRRAVAAVARGELWVERRVLTRLLQQLLFAAHSPKLTPREKDILRLIAEGLKNRAIAEKLEISHETVRWHIRSLHAKLGLQDRVGTALYAQQFLDRQPVAPPPDSEGRTHSMRSG